MEQASLQVTQEDLATFLNSDPLAKAKVANIALTRRVRELEARVEELEAVGGVVVSETKVNGHSKEPVPVREQLQASIARNLKVG